MPSKNSLASLFHPKKNVKRDTTPASPPVTKSKPSPASKPSDDDEEDLNLPTSSYQDFRLLSSSLNGWKYDVMKFDSRKPVDIGRWQGPIKLNRKDIRRDTGSSTGPVALRPMLGLDGGQVIGVDGKPVMVDMEGKVYIEGSQGENGNKGKAQAKKKFQKKTRQVFKVPEEVRQLRKEERYPWVMEDSSGQETWTGQLEDLTRAETHAFFMPAANESFKFVPGHRWYKFQRKLKHDMPIDTVSMESAFLKSQKRDPQAWLHQRNGKGPSAATMATFKAESEGRTVSGTSSLVHDAGQSLGPGGRKLRAVDDGMNLFGEDDEDLAAQKRKAREYGKEGDMDEAVYEEDFADDEEKMDVDNEDEEAKELEERLKKEYTDANKATREGYDESDDEDKPGKTKQEKALQRLIRNREGNEAYESDEDKNPYASSEEEEDEEVEIPPPPPPLPVPTRPADVTKPSPESSDAPQTPRPPVVPPQNGTQSRAASPPSPSLGGHSVVAKRATSPKPPKPRNGNVSRSNSPLAHRASSPTSGLNRAASPPETGSRAGSPEASQKKRKATDEVNGAKPKKRKAAKPVVPLGELQNEMVIHWLRETEKPTTRDCIAHFTPYLTSEEKKAKFTALIKEVAQLKNGALVLRSQYGNPKV